MSFLNVSLLALVQGITEWLPVSSSGHLVLFVDWFNMEGSVALDVFLHVASLLVILIFFRQEIKDILLQGFSNKSQDQSRKNWWWYIVISSAITAGLGLVIYNYYEQFRTPESVSWWLLLTTVLLLATKFFKGDKDLSWQHAVVLGFVQGLAVLPGVSRSGAVITLALIMGIKKKQAFDYAFIVAIPAILGSFLLVAKDFVWQTVYLWGFVLTVIVGYLSLAILRSIIKRDYLYLFFIYTLALSLIIKFV